MGRCSTTAGALLLLGLLTGCRGPPAAQGAAPPPAAEAPAAEAPAPREHRAVEGRVQEATADALVLAGEDGEPLRLVADAPVSVRKGDAPATLVDVQPGDEVRAACEVRPDGALVLRSLHVEE